MPTLDCHHCGATLDVHEPVARDAECPGCGADQRCCVNCRHYDTAYHNSCRETEADPVEDKARRNFCEFFSYSRAPFAKAAANPRAADARAKLEGLFGAGGAKPPPKAPFGGARPQADRAEEARRRLDALFGKPKPDADAES